jgi:anti-sigma factor RsiW
MSDHDAPMTDHPVELLADYVQDTLDPGDRRRVQAHIDGCPTCRDEVALATRARASLATLPELGDPGIAAAGLEALRRSALTPVPAPTSRPPSETPSDARPEPRPARARVAWGQLAAVAALVALLAGIVAIPLALRGGERGTSSMEGAATQPPAGADASGIPLIDRGARYTTKGLDQLASGLAFRARPPGATPTAAPVPSPAQLADSPPPTGPVVTEPGAAQTALQCLEQGGGPVGQAVPLYLEEAEVDGVPAYIGVYEIPNVKLNLMLIAVDRQTCNPIYSVRQSI